MNSYSINDQTVGKIWNSFALNEHVRTYIHIYTHSSHYLLSLTHLTNKQKRLEYWCYVSVHYPIKNFI